MNTAVEALPEAPLQFDCAGESLLGIVHASGRASTGVIFVAGGGQYRAGSHRLYVQLARALAAEGVASLRFDHRGVGDSSGRFTGFEHLERDIAAAVAALRRNQPGLERVVILGLCDGASAALLAAATPGIDGLVLVNPWVHSQALEAQTRIASYYRDRLRSREFWGKALRGQLDLRASLRSLRGYLADAFRGRRAAREGEAAPAYVERMLLALERYRGPVLAVLSGQDLVAQQFQQLVTRDRRWKEALGRESTEVASFQAADHTFSYREHRQLLQQRLAGWLSAAWSRV